jgi:hypothetical protein
MAKMRSPNYPAVGLSQAIAAAGKLWKEEKRTAVAQNVAAKALGYKGLNGPARMVLSAMKKYGLLDGRGNAVKLSDQAITILHSEPDSEQRAEALRKAALRPDLFRELYQSHREASDTALTSCLMVQKSFSDAGARQCITAFRDTLAVANLKASGYSPDAGTEPDEMEREETHDPGTLGGRKLPTAAGEREWQRLVLPDGRTVRLLLSGPEPTQREMGWLIKYLTLTKGVLPPMIFNGANGRTMTSEEVKEKIPREKFQKKEWTRPDQAALWARANLQLMDPTQWEDLRAVCAEVWDEERPHRN